MEGGYTPELIKTVLDCSATIQNLAVVIEHLLIDSRKIVNASKSLFFALQGKQNSHYFIPDLYCSGVRNFVISDSLVGYTNYSDANFYQVQDTKDALQKIATFHREQFKYPVIGITGSNGKTIVKDWLYQLLSPEHNIVRSPKSYNSQIGVPLSVWQMNAHHTLALIEAGISKTDEMGKLAKIIQPTIGILTNIKTAHDEGFSSKDEKLKEKWNLLDKAETVIYSPDYVTHKPINKKQFTWSFQTDADLKIVSIERSVDTAKIVGVYKQEKHQINIHITDDASVENAVICWAVMLSMNYDRAVIEDRMRLLHPMGMRLELKEGINQCSIINDSYSADLSSLFIAVDFLNQQQQHVKKTIILSDIYQTDNPNLYKSIADFIKEKGITRIIGIGADISKHAILFTIQKQFFNSTEDFLNQFSTNDFEQETILLKGARSFGFERISKLLEQKTHETVLEINLNAIVHNLNFYRSMLRPETRIMAMVKAFSYGSGSYEIANLLQYNKVDYLAVAYADEGVALREAGISLPIMVMSPDASSFEAMIKYNLEPELYSFRIFNKFIDFIKAKKITAYSVHLKLDTGMHRLGFEENQLNELLSMLKKEECIKVASVFSHLAASEDSFYDAFTNQQLIQFGRMSDTIHQSLKYNFIRHIANTAAVLRFPHVQYDMVRLGIGIYGVDTTSRYADSLQKVVTLKTTVTQLRKIQADETVGYGRKGKVNKASTIATVKIGYADGYSRALGNGRGWMMVNGQKAFTLGSICMDMCMLDVTDIEVKEGDEVIVFGESPTVDELAEILDTIPYELLTAISQRVKRVYYYE